MRRSPPPSHTLSKNNCVTDRVVNILLSSTSHPEKSTNYGASRAASRFHANGYSVISDNHRQLPISIFLFYGLDTLLKEPVKLFSGRVCPARETNVRFLKFQINLEVWQLKFAGATVVPIPRTSVKLVLKLVSNLLP